MEGSKREGRQVGLVGNFKGEIMRRNFLGGRLLLEVHVRWFSDEDRNGPVFVATRLLSPLHLNLVVVSAALFVIDFDDSCVIV